jgi:hypothetical protein
VSSLRRRAAAALFLALMIAPGCDAAERPAAGDVLAPNGDIPGRRLPWPEASKPVTDWSFAAGEEEIALETVGRRGRRSVTVWSIVDDGKLYVATDDGRERKSWVAQIDRDPSARVGIRKLTYPVRARPVREQAEFDRVMAAFAKKYGSKLAKYDFPKAGDMKSGRVFELASRQ